MRRVGGREWKFLREWSGFESGENMSEVIDAEQANTLEGRRMEVGRRDAQQLVGSVRLTKSEGADHAAGGVASDLVRWRSGWWWKQPEHHSRQSQMPIGMEPICDGGEFGISEGGSDAGLEEASKPSRFRTGTGGSMSDGHHFVTMVTMDLSKRSRFIISLRLPVKVEGVGGKVNKGALLGWRAELEHNSTEVDHAE